MAKKKKPINPNLDLMANRGSDAVAHDGRSKTDRYKWVTELGPLPELRMVALDEIAVDRSYQRNVNESKVVQIASEFYWPAFGVALLCRRPDGTLVAADTQHRIFGALRRGDIKEIPAAIYDVTSVEEEARIFLKVNMLRRCLSALDRFRPQVITGDPATAVVNELVASSDRTLGATGPKGIRCIRILVSFARLDADRLRRLWPLLLDVCADKPLADIVVGGLFWLEGAAAESICSGRWAKRVVSVGHERLVLGARRMATGYAKGGDKVYALGMLEEINKGLQRRLTLRSKDIAA